MFLAVAIVLTEYKSRSAFPKTTPSSTHSWGQFWWRGPEHRCCETYRCTKV